MYQGGGARCLAGIMAQVVCHLRKLGCTEHCSMGGTVAQGIRCSTVSWHRVSGCLRYQPPPPGVHFLKPWGGYGGAPSTQEVPNSEAGDLSRADARRHQVGYDWRSPVPRCRADAWERADVASSPTSAQIGHEPPACNHLAKCARPLTPSLPQPN